MFTASIQIQVTLGMGDVPICLRHALLNAKAGEKDAWAVARERAKHILDTHHPSYLSKAQDAAIRDRFKIL
ncbi:MAG: hypothetical protein AAF903_06750 [Pseudomonadota bacterium]